MGADGGSGGGRASPSSSLQCSQPSHPRLHPKNRRGSSEQACCRAAPETSDISTIGRCQCAEKDHRDSIRVGPQRTPWTLTHWGPEPGALACTFSLTPAGSGVQVRPCPSCPFPLVPQPGPRGRSSGWAKPPSLPHPPLLPDQMPSQICPGLQIWGALTSAPQPAHPLSRVALSAPGGSASPEGQSAPVPLSRPRQRPPHCWGPRCSRVGAAPGSRRPARPQQKQRLQAACELGAVVAGDLDSRIVVRWPPDPAPPTPAHPAPRTLLLCAGRRRCGRVAMPCSLSISSCARGGGRGVRGCSG